MNPNRNGRFEEGRRRQGSESDNFVYDDADVSSNEIAELYGYRECSEFHINLKMFKDQMVAYGLDPCWQKQSLVQKKSTIAKLLDQLEVSNKDLRIRAARCFLYLAQGCWNEVQPDKDEEACTRENVALMFQSGAFHMFVELLFIEIDNCWLAVGKLPENLAEWTDLRVLLSVIYIVVEVMRTAQDSKCNEWKTMCKAFKHYVSNPIEDELIAVKLFRTVTKFCNVSVPHFPIKKILLLLWKIILVSLGGTDTLRRLKCQYRLEYNLPVVYEDTVEITRTMKASCKDLNSKSQKRPLRGFIEELSQGSPCKKDVKETCKEVVELCGKYGSDNFNETPRPSCSQTGLLKVPVKRFPWKSKVRLEDLNAFLEDMSIKFVGFPLKDDRDLFVLPKIVHDSVTVLKRHLYTSLADIQIQQELNLAKRLTSTSEKIPCRMTPTEILYQAMLPNLSQYMIDLLRLLLAVSSTSKIVTDSITIKADIKLRGNKLLTVLRSERILDTDAKRHDEITVKAISAILLLLLKHFKINHVYQFEFMSEQLVSANCIPLILHFLKENGITYVKEKNTVPYLEFPAYVYIVLRKHLDKRKDNQEHSWRNMFSCINLLRVLNKLTKWKRTRIMMLVNFRSVPTLQQTFKVRNAMMQLYVLKLLKMQTKFLGRQWRKSNMITMNLIYHNIRHHLHDDWAYGNVMFASLEDLKADECALKSSVHKFNKRYSLTHTDFDFEAVDTCLTSVLASDVELTDEFKQHYDVWLQHQVFQTNINWDEVLNYSYL